MADNVQKIVLKRSHTEILNILKQSCALNAYEIFNKLQQNNIKKISQTTVYRALNYLTEANILKSINLNDGHTRYELVDHDFHHHHFFCTNCNELKLINCPDELINELIPEGFKLKYHNLELFGTCDKCSKV